MFSMPFSLDKLIICPPNITSESKAMPESKAPHLPFAVPSGYSVGNGPDGVRYMVPNYLVPATDLALRSEQEKSALNVHLAPGGVRYVLTLTFPLLSLHYSCHLVSEMPALPGNTRCRIQFAGCDLSCHISCCLTKHLPLQPLCMDDLLHDLVTPTGLRFPPIPVS
jgi:hypothetical protein